jgi:hypothetical protein
MMFGLERMDFSGDFLLISVQPGTAATEKEAIPIVFRKSRRVCFLGMNGAFHLVYYNR